MIRTLKTLSLAAALMLAAAPAAYAQNLLIRGGPIHTGDEARPTAEVVIVRDGRIAYVGAANGAPSPEGLEVVDLKGAALFPGFTTGPTQEVAWTSSAVSPHVTSAPVKKRCPSRTILPSASATP